MELALSLSLARLGIGSTALTPEQQIAALFSEGEQGAWYDPSDTTTLFQAYTGGAVTEVEQPVGIILDKRKGLALEAALNVDFTSGWSGVAGGTVTDSNTFTCASVGGITKSMLTIGKAYKLTVSYVKTGLSTQFTINNHSGSTTNTIYTATAASGSATITFYATNASLYFRCDTADTIDVTWSIQAIEGNHAYQTTSSARPHLRSRYNLLTYSEQFNQWTPIRILAFGSGSVANAATAPDGTTTADYIVPNTDNNSHAIYQTITATTGIFSCYVKQAGYSKVMLYDATTTLGRGFNLADGTDFVVSGISSTATYDIEDVGDGWYRCLINVTATTSPRIYILNDSGVSSFVGDTSKGLYVWGAQLVLGSTAMSYQRIAAAPTLSQPPTYATTSTMGGEVFRPYLWWDGSDDRLLTGVVDFSATDEMTVCVGVWANSTADANGGLVVELGDSSAGAVNNSFTMTCPPSDQTGVFWRSRGTASASVDSSTPARPFYGVLTGQGDISADSCVLRVNASELGTSATDQGTGNYSSTYILQVGARPTQNRFNGYMYALLVRGKTSTAGEIATLESYVAGKTGVTL